MENGLADTMIVNSFLSSEDFVTRIMEHYMDMEAYNNLFCNFIFRDTEKIVERKVVEIRREQHVKIERKQETNGQRSYTYNKYAVLQEIINRYNTVLQDMINRHGDSAAWQIMSPMLESILAFYRKSFAMEKVRERIREETGTGTDSKEIILLQDRKELSARIHKISEKTVSRVTYEAVRRLEKQIEREKDKDETDTEEVKRLKRKVDEHTKHIEKIEQMQKELMKAVTEEKELGKRERLYQQVFEDSEKLEQMRYGLL